MRTACFFSDDPNLLHRLVAALARYGAQVTSDGQEVWFKGPHGLWSAHEYRRMYREIDEVDGVWTATDGTVVDTRPMGALVIECRSERLVAETAAVVAATIAPYRLWVQGDDDTLWPGDAVDPERLLL